MKINTSPIQAIASDIERTLRKSMINPDRKFGTADRILRFEFPIRKMDPLEWIKEKSSATRFYFKGKAPNATAFAGIGSIYDISAGSYDELASKLKIYNRMAGHRNLKLFGGIAFPDSTPDDQWRNFGKIRFIVPQFEVNSNGNSHKFAINVLHSALNENFLHSLSDKIRILGMPSAVLDPEKITLHECIEFPDFPTWKRTVNQINREIEADDYKKIVLARTVRFEGKSKIDPVEILLRLRKGLKKRYDFLFQFEHDNGFIGSSMERFIKRYRRQLKSEAIAGSIKRGDTPKEDKLNAVQLLNSNKDIREQAFVRDYIKTRLTPMTEEISVDENPVLMGLKESYHLISSVSAILRKGVSDLDIVKAIHPTPAVGGVPWEKTRPLIREYEGFPRGWYAGIVGYLGTERSDLAVALRSALIHNKQITLYSGVGLVKGSLPEKEWEEGNWKLKNFRELLND